MASHLLLVSLSRDSPNKPWGFRVQGGVDYGAPLTIQKVNPDSIAEKTGLLQGDTIMRIGNRPSTKMLHEDAQEAIIRCGNQLSLTVQRVDFRTIGTPVLKKSEVYRMLQEERHSTGRRTASRSPEPSSAQQTYQSQSFIRIQKSLNGNEQPTSPTSPGPQDYRKGAPAVASSPTSRPVSGGGDSPQYYHQNQQPDYSRAEYQQPRQPLAKQWPPPQYQQPQPQQQQPPQQIQSKWPPPQYQKPHHYQPQQYQPQQYQQRAPVQQQQYSPQYNQERPHYRGTVGYQDSQQQAHPQPTMAGSPLNKRRPIWPPQETRQRLQTSTQSIHWAASKGSKKFVWPPPKEYINYEYIDGENLQNQPPPPSKQQAQQMAQNFLPEHHQIPRTTPRSPARLAAQAWQPYSGAGGPNGQQALFTKQARKTRRFEDVIRQSNSTPLPPTYRPPPGTQHVTFEYMD